MHGDTHTFDIREGAEVIGVGGEKLGKVLRVRDDAIVVREGAFFPQEHAIPLRAITRIDGDTIYLGVSGDAALANEWDVVDTTTATDGTGGGRSAGLEVDPEPFVHGQDTQATHINADEDIIVPVVEEELAATAREVERGEVRVHKDVVEEHQTFEVPVTEEEVELTRRRVDRPVTDADRVFEDETISVPLRGEEVDLERRTRVVEEIDIDKTARKRTERVSDTVRREEVRIDGANVDVEREGTSGNRGNSAL